VSTAPIDTQVWANPDTESTPTIHFPPLAQPMARMTENMNLQQALYKRIKAVGQGIVDIKEGGRVSEMKEGGDGRWVGLRIGEKDWVRGSLIVSPVSALLPWLG
jgi:ubiquinone biosynthesis monooxygenase Coq6